MIYPEGDGVEGHGKNAVAASARHGAAAGVTRRHVIKRAGGAVVVASALPAFIAACGGSAETATTATTGGDVGGSIDFLGWEGYDLPKPMAGFRSSEGVKLKASYIGSQNDVQAKLTGGGQSAGFDLTNYYQAYKPLYAELDILEPMDPERLPNLGGLFPFFAEDPEHFWKNEDGTWSGVPFTWGANALTYDSARTAKPTSYDVILEPEFKGKVAMADETVTTVALVSHILGLDPTRLTSDDFDKVKDYLARVIAQTKGVSASYGDVTTQLVSGEAVFAFPGWASINSFAADAGKDSVKTTVPKEGGVSFADIYAIPRGADNVDAALAWINESIDVKVNGAAQNFLIGGTPVRGAVKHLDPAVASLYPYDDIDAYFEQVPMSKAPPEQSDEFVTLSEVLNAWQELKAGGGA